MALPPSTLSKLSLDTVKKLHGAVEVFLELDVKKVEDMRNLQESLSKSIGKQEHPVPRDERAWMGKVSLPERYEKKSSLRIKDTAARGISLQQLQDLGAFIEAVLATPDVDVRDINGVLQTWEAANLYVINSYFVKPLTWKDQISFVELIAEADQTPSWFISHWWGTAFHQSLRMLRLHHQTRKLEPSSFYWMCTFANNQHRIDKELCGELSHSPFLRVLRSSACCGTIALMDRDATPFSRIWCVLEAFESMKLSETKLFPYDMAAWMKEGSCGMGKSRCAAQANLLLDDEAQTTCCEEMGQKWPFPWVVATAAARTQVKKANSSRAEDKEAILKYIQGKEMELDTRIHQQVSLAAMHGFCLSGDRAMIAQLLHEFPLLLNGCLDNNGATPIFVASHAGRADALRLLIEARGDIDKEIKAGGTTATFIAAQEGHLDALTILLASRADIDKSKDNGASPAFVAAQRGQLDALKVLISFRADIDQRNAGGATPALVAAQEGRVDVLRLLISSRASIKTGKNTGATPLYVAAQVGQLEALRLLIASGADCDRSKDDGATPAYVAAQNGHTEALKLLVASRADIHKGTTVGTTPTFVAAQEGQLDALSLLIASQADIENSRDTGASPLYIAAQEGHLGTLRLLLSHRADLNRSRHDGFTPIAIARSRGHQDVVQELLKAGAA